MLKHTKLFFFSFLLIGIKIFALDSTALLPSTEGDPDSFIDHYVNVINGDYCETATDLTIEGPDVFHLMRFYNSKSYLTNQFPGIWRLFTSHFLVLGKDPEYLEKTLAFTGDRSGGILSYCGWRKSDGTTEEPLELNGELQNLGLVNTYAGEMSGQTNHKNTVVHCLGKACRCTLGDGTIRIYEKVKSLPSQIFGEELNSYFLKQVLAPECFRLQKERLPSGNFLLFSYNADGHLKLKSVPGLTF